MRSTASPPPRFEDRSLEGYQPTTDTQRQALAAARRLIAGEIDSLVLIGPTGIGKTHLAAAIVNAELVEMVAQARTCRNMMSEWEARRTAHDANRPQRPLNDPEQGASLEAWMAHRTADRDAWFRATEAWRDELTEIDKARPKPVQLAAPEWANVAELILGLRHEIGQPADDREFEQRVLRLRRHPALVVLDDLGREKVSDWTGETIYSLVNARYEAMLPTLVTSNLTPAELAASPYWPVISRLAEDGALVAIDAPDHRTQRSA